MFLPRGHRAGSYTNSSNVCFERMKPVSRKFHLIANYRGYALQARLLATLRGRLFDDSLDNAVRCSRQVDLRIPEMREAPDYSRSSAWWQLVTTADAVVRPGVTSDVTTENRPGCARCSTCNGP